VLLCEMGRYEEAIAAAKVRHFHTYEGGEGNLTKQHAWMHVLYANELVKAGDLKKAEQMYRDAKLVLDNCQLLATRIRVSAKDGTKTNWQDV